MEVRVLGCYGGELPGYRMASLIVDGKLLMDAGSVTSVLSLSEQRRIANILVSHTHLDHIKDIPFLAANLVGERLRQPINIISTGEIIEAIKSHLFNDALWPDFTVLPTIEFPVVKLMPIKPEEEVQLQEYTIRAIPVNHTVPAVAYVVRKGRSAIIYSGDTGPTERLWEEANGLKELKAILMESSFPNRLRTVAESSGHLTPAMLQRELRKLKRKDVSIYLIHMKPQYLALLKRELRRLGHPRVSFLQQGERYRF